MWLLAFIVTCHAMEWCLCISSNKIRKKVSTRFIFCLNPFVSISMSIWLLGSQLGAAKTREISELKNANLRSYGFKGSWRFVTDLIVYWLANLWFGKTIIHGCCMSKFVDPQQCRSTSKVMTSTHYNLNVGRPSIFDIAKSACRAKSLVAGGVI